MNKVLHWIMLFSLLMVFFSGILLKGMPGMWLGIAHGVSGLTLTASVLIHVFQRCRVSRKGKKAAEEF